MEFVEAYDFIMHKTVIIPKNMLEKFYEEL